MNEAEWKIQQKLNRQKKIAQGWKGKHHIMRTYRDILIGVVVVQVVLDVVLLVMVFRLLSKLYG